MTKQIIKLLCWIDNFCYKVISYLAIRDNDGDHPKHAIMDYHSFFLENITENDTVLDIGCGNGTVAFDVSKKAKKVVAVDIVKKNIMTAKKRFSRENLDYIFGDATTYQFQNNFDVIVLSNVLEHIENRVQFLEKIKNLSDKFLIRVPLLTRDWLAVYKKNLGMEYRLDETHYIEYTEEKFRKEIAAAGLTIKDYRVRFGEIYSIVNNNQQ